jgi:hypothetical protein
VRGAACHVCEAEAFARTKQNARLSLSKLVDVYGSRLVLESVSDYLRRISLNVWAHRFDSAAAELGRDVELHELRREVKRLRRFAARAQKLGAAAEKLAA